MAGITDLIAAGKELGIFEFYLPFIIMFAIIYGILKNAKIFGKDANNINLIIALSASLFVMVFTPVGPGAITLAMFLSDLFAGTLMVVVTILTFLIITYMVITPFGGQEKMNVGKFVVPIVLVALILALGVFVASGGLAIFPGLSFGPLSTIPIPVFPGISTPDIAMVLVVAATGLAMFYMVKGGDGGGSQKAGAS